MRTKRSFERSVRTTITLPPRLMYGAEVVFAGRGFGGLSDYVQELIRRDIEKREPQILAPR